MGDPRATKETKISRTISVTKAEITEFDRIGEDFGLERSELLLALMEALKSIPLVPTLVNHKTVLRPAKLNGAKEAHSASAEVKKHLRPKNPPPPTSQGPEK